MKKIIIAFVLLCLITAFIPKKSKQEKVTVCHSDATVDFAKFAQNKNFIAAHDSPQIISFESKVGGKSITFKTPDGKTASAYEIKAPGNSKKWLLVYQEWWGLNDHIKMESEKLFNDLKDVNILALDMYDGKVATDPQTAGKYMQEAKPERLDAITKGGIEHTGKDTKIASIGWCFGGGRSLQSALAEGKEAIGCVIYYGMPEKDKEKLKTLNCDVLGIFAEQDKYITPEIAKEFEKNMNDAGKKITIKLYNAVHGFANPSNPKYDKEATVDAYKLTINYLKQKFK